MTGDLASLSESAQREGFTQDEVISVAKKAIARSFRKHYPEETQEITVLLDIHSDQTRILSEGKDITPAGFSEQAVKVARSAILGLLEPEKETALPDKVESKSVEDKLMRLLFFGYNALSLFYLFIFSFGLLSADLRELLQETFKAKGVFSIFVLTFIVITPLLSLYLALKERLSNRPGKLAKLFFFYELPTIFTALLLFGILNDPIPAIGVFSLLILALPLVFLLKIIGFQPQKNYKQAALLFLRSVIIFGFAYLVLLYSFYFPLIIGGQVGMAGDFLASFFRSGAGDIIWFMLISPFALLGLLLLAGLSILPYLFIWSLFKQYIQQWKRTRRQLGEQQARNPITASAVFVLLVFLAISYQPSINPFLAELQQLEKADAFEERAAIAEELMPHEQTIKQAIRDSQIAHRRYLFVKEDDFLAREYERDLSLPAPAAQAIQDVFSLVAMPFVYQGPTDRNGELSRYYEELFGKKPYTDYYYQDYKPYDPKDVHLASRKVEVVTDPNTDGLLATISIEEIYENNGSGMEEVVYEFSLPTDAVIMDLKLGPDLEFTGVVAPRGAASEVYERELRRSRDPALLEQIGPRQYRLRVFPIPGKHDRTTLNGRNQRVKFSYVVSAETEGYPLPNYTTERNIRQDRKTNITYLLDGVPTTTAKLGGTAYIPQSGGEKIGPCTIFEPIASSKDPSLELVPHSANELINNNFPCDKSFYPFSGKKLALIYDVSYANKDDNFIPELKRILRADKELLSSNAIDLYLFNDRMSNTIALSEEKLDELDIVYFGARQPQKAIRALGRSYDAAVIVTNEESLGQNQLSLQPSYPIYVVHRGDTLPPYSSELTDYILQSGGRITHGFGRTLNHFGLYTALRPEQKYLYVGQLWSIRTDEQFLASYIPSPTPVPPRPKLFPTLSPTPAPTITTNIAGGDPLGFLAARGYILKEIAATAGSIEKNMYLLDQLNRVAEENNVVTPYSSLIALVNEQQMEQLRREKQRYDRYEPSEKTVTDDVGMITRPHILPNVNAGSSFGSFFGISPLGEARRAPALDGGAPAAIIDGGGGGAGAAALLFPLLAISGVLAVGGGLVFLFIHGRKTLRRRLHK